MTSQEPKPSPIANEEKLGISITQATPSIREDINLESYQHDDHDIRHIDLFAPFPPAPSLPEEKQPFTLRAVLAGWALGALVNASNVYLGLKIGFTNDAGMFAVAAGYAMLKLFSQFKHIPLIGGVFGPKEHCIIQSVANAAGGLSIIFTAAIPAMFRAGLLTGSVQDHYWRFVTLTAACGLFGSAIAVPYRAPFIVDLARELRLIFPGAAAIAESIRTLHTSKANAESRRHFKVLASVFLVSLIWVVIKQYAPGILSDWYTFWWFYVWNGHHGVAVDVLNWGFFIFETTPLFVGTGMLIDLNTSGSIVLGYFLGYGIIGPVLIAKGLAVGTAISEEYPDLMTFKKKSSHDLIHSPSPRYWMLWPVIFVSLAACLTDLACHWRVFARSVLSFYKKIVASVSAPRAHLNVQAVRCISTNDEGTGSLSDAYDDGSSMAIVRTWEWLALGLFCAVGTILILHFHWHLNAGTALLALVLGAIFAPIFIIAQGQSGVTPGTVVVDLSQLIIAATMIPVAVQATSSAIMRTLAGESVSTLAAIQILELTTDYKIGLFLNVPIRQQWFAQMAGCLLAIFLSPALFTVYAKAYPCILDAEAETCAFVVPSAINQLLLPAAIFKHQFVARESWVFGVFAALFTVAIHYCRFWTWTTGCRRLSQWIANMLLVALGVLLLQCSGGASGRIPARASVPVAAGAIAGESIAGIVNAILELANASGPDNYGTTIGCPGGSC